MHLVKEGLSREVFERIESDDISEDDRMWYTGRCMGLLEAGALTQEEHDDVLDAICTMFDAYERYGVLKTKGGANG